jgi:hypothetical protein
MPLNEQTFVQTNGTTAIDTILTQEANRIGQDIHRRTVHTSPWMDLIKQGSFPDGMGYTLGTLVYERALPTTAANGSTLGLSWSNVGEVDVSNTFDTPKLDQLLAGAKDSNIGPQTGKSYIQFARQLKQYSMRRAVVESPRINVEDLRFAAYRTEQLRAVMDALTESTKYSWEERYRDEYDRVCANFVPCLTSGTPIVTVLDATPSTGPLKFEGVQTVDVDLTNDFVADGASLDYTPTAYISNKILDTIYMRNVRNGAGTDAYGRENGRPVFGLVCSSEASYFLQTEAGFRDDVRYNQAKVSDLIAPLGVEKSFRGFYHLVDDMAPRYVLDTDTDGGGAGDTLDGTLNRVHPYIATAGIVTLNPAYDTADYEAAYVLHQNVMESQIPEPVSGNNGLKFDPVNYRGKFAWKNIPSVDLNPDGTIGFFRGVLASATKPIKTEFGFVIVYKRTGTLTPAA